MNRTILLLAIMALFGVGSCKKREFLPPNTCTEPTPCRVTTFDFNDRITLNVVSVIGDKLELAEQDSLP